MYNPNGTVQPMVEQMQAAAHAMAMGLMPGMPGMVSANVCVCKLTAYKFTDTYI